MIKNLRYVLMGMLVMFGMSAMAEDIIWQEDWSEVTDFTMNPNIFKSNYTFTGSVLKDDGTVKSGTKFYNESMAGGTAPELLIAKNGGSFMVSILLNGKSGNMTLTYKCNKSITVEEITQKDQMVSEATSIGNDYERAVIVPEGTTEIQLLFTNSNSANARIDNIKLYQGTAKKAAGLSWGKASTSVTLGNEDSYANLPTLQNSNNLSVVFGSTETGVATINESGVITVVGVGKTVISAAFEGNDEYEAQTVTFELTVKEAGGETPGTDIETITVAKALEIGAALEGGKTTEVEYIVNGVVAADPTWTPYNDKSTGELKNYNLQFKMKDANGETTLLVYNAWNLENTYFPTIDDDIKVNTEVSLQGKIQNYVKNEVSTIELVKGHFLKIGTRTSSINSVKAGDRFQGAIYNLRGQRISTPAKGMYIRDGKKFVVK